MKKTFWLPWPPLLLITIIAICTGILDYFTPLMGDDMAKWIAMGGNDSSFPDRQAISFLAAQYFDCNGRIFDALGPLITNLLPGFAASALIGMMTGLFFYALCLSAGVLKKGKTTIACGLICVAMFTLPWWDSMFMRVCNFNYIWATAFALLFVNAWFSNLRPGKCQLFGLFVLGGLAGCMHEQIGVALTAFFGFYVIVRRYRDWHLILFAGLCIGTLLTIASPAIWIRNSEFMPDSSRVEMLMSTLPLVVVMLVVMIVLQLTSNRFHTLLVDDRLRAYAIIAVLCSVIALYSTIPGRTGWLPESFALVVLTMLCEETRFRIKWSGSFVLISICFLSIFTHLAVSIYWQAKMCHEYDLAIEMYRNSNSGVVNMDYTDRLEVSPLTLYRVKGLPDADDTYLLRIFSDHYGHGIPMLLIDSKAEISDKIPTDYTLIHNTIPDTLMVDRFPSGETRIITPFRENGIEKYRLCPLVLDPGDHWYLVK